ncbi:MAG: glycosyltransferase [Pseudomonadota bacterium]
MESFLVSVILPTYNRAWIVKEAIDSVLAQDYANVELIVIDDGSTDNTLQLLETYHDQLMVIRQDNKGVSAARNIGIKKSRGRFIALLDSDDTWDKRKISCQVEFFMANPEALICQTEEVWIRNGKRVNPKFKHQKPSGMIFEPSLNLCLVSPSAVMMRRELFDIKGYFDEALTVCEDYDLWLRVSSDLPVFLIDKPYTIKRGGHDDQLSSFHSQDKFRIQSMINLLESNCLTIAQTEKVKQVLRKKCKIYGNGCIKRGRKEEGQFYLGSNLEL